MTVALVLGGAACVHDDIAAAQQLFVPDVIVAVKDIGITWPHVDHWATFHPERLPKELKMRRDAGLPDPKCIWLQLIAKVPREVDLKAIEVRHVKIAGGSSGLLGVLAALQVADKAVITGIPLDPKLKHYRRPKKQGWPPAMMYRLAWRAVHSDIKDRVRSMSGWTREFLGAPTKEWLSS